MGNLCERAKVKPFGYHSIRHLTASTLYKRDYTVAHIQAVLRHESATTTAKYIRSLGVRVSVLHWKHYLSKKAKFYLLDHERLESRKSLSQKEKAVSGAVNS
jgi:integrase